MLDYNMDKEAEDRRTESIRMQVEKFKPDPKMFGKTMIERWKYLDGDFRDKVNEMEKHYLTEANAILNEVITEIRSRIAKPDTTMNDLIKALDVISNKYSLAMGLPTNTNLNVNVVKNMNDEELDKRISELEHQFLSSPSAPESSLPSSESNPTPSLLSCGTSQEHLSSKKKRRNENGGRKLSDVF
jgi:hypothetical protein